MSYFYGPVPSRRLGFSLGVDLTPKKTCSFDCLYCHVGKATVKTLKRFWHVDLKKLSRELKDILKTKPKINYITFSGSGEPTLHKGLDKIIKVIRKITNNHYKIAVLTNSSLLYKKNVRKELLAADLIIPSLDTASPVVFKKLKKPVKSINLSKIINGLINLRKEFKGKIWLETMLVKGVNDSLEEALNLRTIIAKIKPDKIQINVPIRPSTYSLALPDKKRIEYFKKAVGLNIDVVSKFTKGFQRQFSLNLEKDITSFLNRRPANFSDLEKSLGIKKKDLQKSIVRLIETGKIKQRITPRGLFFVRGDF